MAKNIWGIQQFPRIHELKKFSYSWYADKIKANLKISKDTKIVSMGSCFAMEIRKMLMENGYNYLQEEDKKNPWANIYSEDHQYELGSCAWERVFHLFGLNQILHYTFGVADFRDRLYNHGKYCYDLLRTRIAYPSKKVAEKDLVDHIEKSRKVLSECELFIFTMGLVEIWEYNNVVLATSPQHTKIDLNAKFRVSTYAENLAALNRAYSIFRKHNPDAHFMITVSPVHLRATFRQDTDILSATSYSKATLRTVANDFIKEHPEVHYFPSYEIVTILANIVGDVSYPEGHHVNRRVVKKIMNIFRGAYCE
jgi:hypothetical protein